MDINKISFNHNNTNIELIFDSSIIKYNNLCHKVSSNKLLDILKSIMKIIHNWDHEYIDLNTYDGNDWSLDILYSDKEKESYKGHAMYPNNFDKLDDLFTNILKEVL